MDCLNYRDFYSEFVEGDYSSFAPGVEDHLKSCVHCRAEMEKLHRMIAMLHAMPQIEPPARLRVSINAKLDEAQNEGKIVRLFRMSGTFSKGLAMAATVVLVFLGSFYVTDRIPPMGKTELAVMTPFDYDEESKVADLKGKVADVSADADAVAPGAPAAGETDTIKREMAYEGPRFSLRSRRAVYGSADIRPVGLVDASPAPYYGESAIARPTETYGAPAAAPEAAAPRVIYPDYIVVITADNIKETAEQVNNSVLSSEGEYLEYSQEVKYVLLPVELADHFIQTIQSLGKTKVISGSIERQDAKRLLIAIIIASDSQ